MEPKMSARVVELLCSRLCHDLISPVGAVKSGLELLAEFDDDPGGEAMALITSSAESASLKLRFFRVAFGLAGATQADLSLTEAKLLADAMVGSARTTLVWPGAADTSAADTSAADGGAPAPGVVKLALNLILLAADMLPRGGTITARLAAAAADGSSITIDADAVDARITDETRASISGQVADEDLTPRTIQGYFTWVLLQRCGATLDLGERPGEGISLRTTIRHGA